MGTRRSPGCRLPQATPRRVAPHPRAARRWPGCRQRCAGCPTAAWRRGTEEVRRDEGAAMARLHAVVLAVVVAVLAACGHAESSGGAPGATAAAPTGDAFHGRDLVGQFECARCHIIAGISPLPKEKQCTGCHADINAGTVTATPA